MRTFEVQQQKNISHGIFNYCCLPFEFKRWYGPLNTNQFNSTDLCIDRPTKISTKMHAQHQKTNFSIYFALVKKKNIINNFVLFCMHHVSMRMNTHAESQRNSVLQLQFYDIQNETLSTVLRMWISVCLNV